MKHRPYIIVDGGLCQIYPPTQKATPACRNACLPTGKHFGVQARSLKPWMNARRAPFEALKKHSRVCFGGFRPPEACGGTTGASPWGSTKAVAEISYCEETLRANWKVFLICRLRSDCEHPDHVVVLLLELKIKNGPHTAINKSVAELLVKSRSCPHSCAVGDTDLFNLHLLQSPDGFLELLRSQEIEMSSSQDCIELLLTGLGHHVVDNIHHPRVSTT